MATHSSVLAWRIPGTGEPGWLLSMGRTESDMTETTYQQQRQWYKYYGGGFTTLVKICIAKNIIKNK